ncbi:MAG: hypothetical protein ABSA93_03465 [Streptosporangiaceae bacterium]
MQQEQFAAGGLYPHDGLDRGPRRERIQDGGDGDAFERGFGAEAAASEAPAGLDEAGAADLHVFDLDVGHLSQHRCPPRGGYRQPFFKEPQVIPFACVQLRSRDVSSEVGHITHGGQGTGFKLTNLARIWHG